MKVGDLIYIKASADIEEIKRCDGPGIITHILHPTPALPYMILTIAFGDQIYDGIPHTMVELISET